MLGDFAYFEKHYCGVCVLELVRFSAWLNSKPKGTLLFVGSDCDINPGNTWVGGDGHQPFGEFKQS